jgi:hypothetical protein
MFAAVRFYPTSIHTPCACTMICVTWLNKICILVFLYSWNELDQVSCPGWRKPVLVVCNVMHRDEMVSIAVSTVEAFATHRTLQVRGALALASVAQHVDLVREAFPTAATHCCTPSIPRWSFCRWGLMGRCRSYTAPHGTASTSTTSSSSIGRLSCQRQLTHRKRTMLTSIRTAKSAC